MAKIAVVGCGAMGSVSALMVDAGHEVHAVTLWPDHAEAKPSAGWLRLDKRRRNERHKSWPPIVER